jgi:dipeptidase E
LKTSGGKSQLGSPTLFLGSDGCGALPTLFLNSRRRLLAFIPTAAYYLPRQLQQIAADDRRRLESLGFACAELDLRSASRSHVERVLASVDAAFVSGGSVYYLLAWMHHSGFATAITTAVSNGLIYAGVSGGAMAAAADLTPWTSISTEPLETRSTKPLGLTDALVLPHAEQRGERYRAVIEQFGESHRLVPLRDDEALLVRGNAVEVVSSP